jgi:hypothetical protein
MATEWGRKETAIWPPQKPIYSLAALLLAVMVMGFYVWLRLSFAEPPLVRYYTPMYIRSAVGATFHKRGEFRLLFVAGAPGRPARIARPDDVTDGSTEVLVGKPLPMALSGDAKKEGYSSLYRGDKQRYADAALHSYLKAAVWGGADPSDSYEQALVWGAIALLLMLPFAIRRDIRRRKEMKYGRLLKGPEMVTPREFNTRLQSGGLGIQTMNKLVKLKIPARAEAKHIQVMGDTGVGKTTLFMQMLEQIERRGDSAIVYDPAGEFIQRFYNERRCDIVLNPLDQRCPYWSPSSELVNPAEARTIAASLYQPTDDKKGEFFTVTPQKIFAQLLRYRPTPQQLIAWMSDENEIYRRVEKTELAQVIAKGAENQRSGVLASLGLIADSLRLLPTLEQASGKEWSATKWAEDRKGWIFLTSKESEQEALRPLHSLWLDLLILRLMTPPKEGQRRAWFLIDELASLQRLPQFHSALTKGRKSGNPIIFGYQGKAQLEVIWGHLAEVMLSQPATKFIMKTSEPKAAKWASELIGEVEIERVRETVADGRRAGRSFTQDRQIEPLVMASEIEGLEDLHTFVKHGNYVSRFAFPRMDRKVISPALMAREIPDKEMWIDPLDPIEETDKPSAQAVQPKPADASQKAGNLTVMPSPQSPDNQGIRF